MLVNQVIKAYAKVLLHQEMYTRLPEAMNEARTNFLPCKESSDLLIKYVSYANTKLRADGDSFKQPYDPLAAFKNSKNFGDLLSNANVEQEQHVDEFERNVAPRLGVDPIAFTEASARLERTAPLQVDCKVAEALKSIPGHAQEAITNLTSALPLLQCCRDFINVTATEINSQPKVNAYDPYIATSREALSAIKAVVDLLRSWLKDLTMQHLLQGGSYSLVSFGKHDETLENMGLGLTEEELRAFQKVRGDFQRENPPTKTADRGRERSHGGQGGARGGASRGQGSYQGGGGGGGSQDCDRGNSQTCSQCGNGGHSAGKCFALKHVKGY